MKFEYENYCFRKDLLFEGVSIIDSNLFKDQFIRKVEPPGKIVYRRGSYSRGVRILKRGKVKISRRTRSGKEQILYIFSRGELMGYRSLLCGEPHPVTAITLEECVFSFLPHLAFINAIDQSPAFARLLLSHLGHESTVWMNLMNMHNNTSVKERVLITLLILNEKYRKTGKSIIPSVINLSRENMAAFAGTTVETLVRMLRTFKDENILTTQGRRIILQKPSKLIEML